MRSNHDRTIASWAQLPTAATPYAWRSINGSELERSILPSGLLRATIHRPYLHDIQEISSLPGVAGRNSRPPEHLKATPVLGYAEKALDASRQPRMPPVGTLTDSSGSMTS